MKHKKKWIVIIISIVAIALMVTAFSLSVYKQRKFDRVGNESIDVYTMEEPYIGEIVDPRSDRVKEMGNGSGSYVYDEVLVTIDSDANNQVMLAKEVAERYDAKVIAGLPSTNMYQFLLMEADGLEELNDAIREIDADPDVESAGPRLFNATTL